MKSALILRHLAFEDLGSFAPVLRDAGYQLQDIEAAVDPLPDPLEPDLVVVLGGPIGVNDGAAYPCMTEERNWLAMRLAADRPTLGICLGAQLIAAALGARVAPIAEKEIGFAPLTLTPPGWAGPLAHLSDIPVLHWHGETFDLPAGAVLLASSEVCRHQAFQLGRSVIGLQFHLEANRALLDAFVTADATSLVPAGQVQSAEQILAVPQDTLDATAALLERLLDYLLEEQP